MLRPSLLSSIMMSFEISVSSGLSCTAWRTAAAAGGNPRSALKRGPPRGVVRGYWVGGEDTAQEGGGCGGGDDRAAVDDEGAIDLLVDELEMQLVGERQADQVRDRGAVERREQRHRHIGAELGGIGHVGEHLHHADERADHAEGGRAVAHRAVDLLALVEVGEKDVAVALEIVADEIDVIAVGDEADALGEEPILRLDLLEPDRALLAGDVGERRNLLDQGALGPP